MRGILQGPLKVSAHIGIALSFVATGSVTAYAAQQNKIERIEVAFVLDTTGSMEGLIDGAKRKIWTIANTIVDIQPDADIRMALIGYRDRGDDYVIKSFDMSKDLQALYGNLTRFEADGGGDEPEAVNEALDTAVSKLTWSDKQGTRKIVFLVGDAPPHMDYKGERKYPEIIADARKENILINTVQAGNSAETKNFWKDIAERGAGRYLAIAQDGGPVEEIATPYDQQILQNQQQIDKTIMPYGTRAQQDELSEKMSVKMAAPAAVQVENSKFYSKRSSAKEVITGGGDLIDDVRNKKLQLNSVKESELPVDFKGKSEKERAEIVEKKLSERSRLEEQMTGLVKQRDDYLMKAAAEGNKQQDTSFDKVVSETLKQQLQ